MLSSLKNTKTKQVNLTTSQFGKAFFSKGRAKYGALGSAPPRQAQNSLSYFIAALDLPMLQSRLCLVAAGTDLKATLSAGGNRYRRWMDG